MNKNQRTTTNIKLNNTNIEILKNNFPQCFDKNGDFQIEKFQNELKDNEINFSKESYGIDWLGKSYSRLLASDEATTLLKEDKEFNQKPENINSENLLIKGDNLEVLKHLVGAYYEKIKMIYIDPPYNTGTDGFVYNDDRKFTVNQLKELAGIDEDKAKRILEFIQSNSNSHSAWLTFMYPRLYIAKQLLKDDGVIFISIDDNEVAQLRLIMDEIFGEENFIGEITWLKKRKGSFLSKQLVSMTEYVLVYSKYKSNSNTYLFGGVADEKESQPIIKRTNQVSVLKIKPNVIKTKLENGTYKKGIYGDNVNPVELLNDVVFENGYNLNEFEIKAPFTWSQDFFDDELKKGSMPIINTLNFQIRVFRINDEESFKGFGSLIDGVKIKGTNEDAYEELESLFGLKKVFDYSKPKNLIKELVTASTKFNNNAIVLDFFAGSGTTGHAVMQLNSEDGGDRKFILAQLPEEINKVKNKEAYDFVKNELGVETPTIFEITKERLIRAAKRLKEDGYKGDLGFKIFETMPIWEDYNFEADELNKELNLFDDEKLTADDINALLTTWKTYDGVSLTKNLEEIDLGGYLSYYGNGKLYLMSEGFNTDNLKFMLEKIDNDKNFNPTSIIVFGYKFESKNLREIAENIKAYSNKKNIDIDFITRY